MQAGSGLSPLNLDQRIMARSTAQVMFSRGCWIGLSLLRLPALPTGQHFPELVEFLETPSSPTCAGLFSFFFSPADSEPNFLVWALHRHLSQSGDLSASGRLVCMGSPPNVCFPWFGATCITDLDWTPAQALSTCLVLSPCK